MLDELEKDALSEVINMGIGHAAGVLSELAGETVNLSVPVCIIESRDVVIGHMEKKVISDISAIRQSFKGPLEGHSLLVFPEKESIALVQLVLGDMVSDSPGEDLVQDALKEVGNVIMTSCLGTMADVFDVHLQNSLPDVLYGPLPLVINQCSGEAFDQSTLTLEEINENVVMLLIEVDFQLDISSIKGYVVLLFGLSAIQNLEKLVKAYLVKMGLRDA